MAALPWRELAVAGAVRLLLSLGLLAVGFEGISDDDYARAVIAQSFAVAPRLDPSGTSWLPAPFWAMGGVFWVGGRSLLVARAAAVAGGIVTTWLVFLAARYLDLDRRRALAAALLATCVPYSAWLGAAMVPDAPTAALILVGACAASRSEPQARWVGSAALLLATLCRYEAWPAAAVVAGLGLLDALRRRSWALALASVGATLGSAAWLLHGFLHHGDAFFFVSRVSAYRAALGVTPASLATVALGQLRALVTTEPELCALTALGLGLAFATRLELRGQRYHRVGLVVAALFAFLVVGDWRNAAPTHHGERALLTAWLALAVLAADCLGGLASRAGGRARVLGGLASGVLVAFVAGVVRPRVTELAPFARRGDERAIGAAARALVPERLVVDTADYGYFAVIAAFGAPERAVAWSRRDPRRSSPEVELTPTTLRARLHEERATWLITSLERGRALDALAVERARAGQLVLLELRAPAP